MNSMKEFPGFYGKLPILGDFVSRRLPADFVRPWDVWLQEAIVKSREQLGSGWLDVYLTSPIWRFVLSHGNCGGESWAGILMPSVDKVGRYFPLTLAAPVERRDVLPRLFSAGSPWFDRLEGPALSALEDELDVEELDRELQKHPLEHFLPSNDAPWNPEGMNPEGIESAGMGIEPGNGPFAFQVEMTALDRVRDAFVNLSGGLLVAFLPAYSLWCTNGSEWVKPS